MTGPPEELIIAARALERNVFAVIDRVDWSEVGDPPDWRIYVPPDVRRLWGRLGNEP